MYVRTYISIVDKYFAPANTYVCIMYSVDIGLLQNIKLDMYRTQARMFIVSDGSFNSSFIRTTVDRENFGVKKIS